jgi:hypothetical protein
MTDTDFQQPGLGSLRASAEAAELAQAASGLVTVAGYRLTASDPLARDIARSMTAAGLTVHQCAQHDPLHWLGGGCVLAFAPEPGTGRGGIVVSWTAHHLLLLDWDRYGTYAATQRAMHTALGEVMLGFGYPVTPFGSGGAWLITGPRATEVER